MVNAIRLNDWKMFLIHYGWRGTFFCVAAAAV